MIRLLLAAVVFCACLGLTRLQIQVLNFTVTPRNQAGWVGDDITLTAAAVVPADQYVTWFKNNTLTGVLWNSMYEDNAIANSSYTNGARTSRLTLHNVNLQEGGLYGFMVNDYTHFQRMAWISVLESVTCSTSHPWKVHSNQELTFSCTAVHGSQLPINITWVHQGEKLAGTHEATNQVAGAQESANQINDVKKSTNQTASTVSFTMTSRIDHHEQLFTCYVNFAAPTKSMIEKEVTKIGTYKLQDVARERPDFEGGQCSIKVLIDEECISEPCRHGGTCVDELLRFTCICAPQFVGKLCELPVACTSNPCTVGTCVERNGGYSCQTPTTTSEDTTTNSMPEIALYAEMSSALPSSEPGSSLWDAELARNTLGEATKADITEANGADYLKETPAREDVYITTKSKELEVETNSAEHEFFKNSGGNNTNRTVDDSSSGFEADLNLPPASFSDKATPYIVLAVLFLAVLSMIGTIIFYIRKYSASRRGEESEQEEDEEEYDDIEEIRNEGIYPGTHSNAQKTIPVQPGMRLPELPSHEGYQESEVESENSQPFLHAWDQETMDSVAPHNTPPASESIKSSFTRVYDDAPSFTLPAAPSMESADTAETFVAGEGGRSVSYTSQYGERTSHKTVREYQEIVANEDGQNLNKTPMEIQKKAAPRKNDGSEDPHVLSVSKKQDRALSLRSHDLLKAMPRRESLKERVEKELSHTNAVELELTTKDQLLQVQPARRKSLKDRVKDELAKKE